MINQQAKRPPPVVPYLYDALTAAANGFAVLPADGRTGEPLIDVALASTDPETIRKWWDEHPMAQPACMTPKSKQLKATPYIWREPASIPQAGISLWAAPHPQVRIGKVRCRRRR